MSRTRVYIKTNKRGRVNISAASTTVSGSGTQFTAEDVGKEIRFRTAVGEVVRIIAGFVSATEISLDSAPGVSEDRVKYYLGWEELELQEKEPLKLSCDLAEIDRPGGWKAWYSDMIRLPGSTHNNRILGQIFEAGIDSSFDAGSKVMARIETDGFEVLSGVLQLHCVKRTSADAVEYGVRVRSQGAGLFDAVGDMKLEALDLSEFDHAYDKTAQKNTWDAEPGSGYVYPLIDHGLFHEEDNKVFDADKILPCVYLKTYVDKIFEAAGYSYSSGFFHSELFKRLIVPADRRSWKLTSDEVEARSFLVELEGNETAIAAGTACETCYTTGSAIPIATIAGEPYFDNTGGINITSDTWTAGADGWYRIRARIPWHFGYEGIHDNPGESAYSFGFSIGLQVDSEPVVILKNVLFTIPAGTTFGMGAGTLTPSVSLVDSDTQALFTADHVDILHDIHLSAGQVVSLVPLIYDSPDVTMAETDLTSPVIVTGGENSFWTNEPGAHIPYGFAAEMNRAIPRGIKAKELILSVFKAFNLYVEEDEPARQLIIEPRDTFYASGGIKDWTNKLDLSREMSVTPVAALTGKNYLYTYQEDKDLLNERHTVVWKTEDKTGIYGEHLEETENDHATRTVRTELIFSPTPLSRLEGDDKILPAILHSQACMQGHNIRLLYYGGKRACGAWSFRERQDGSSETLAEYPYAGHLDDPGDATLDINFATADAIYFSNPEGPLVKLTNNNLFNTYHKTQIDEITDKDAKLLTAHFRLGPMDIAELDGRDKILVNGQLYRLIQISEHDLVGAGSTKVALLTVKRAGAFMPEHVTVNSGYEEGKAVVC